MLSHSTPMFLPYVYHHLMLNIHMENYVLSVAGGKLKVTNYFNYYMVFVILYSFYENIYIFEFQYIL